MMRTSNRRVVAVGFCLLLAGAAALSGCGRPPARCGCKPFSAVKNPGNEAFYKDDGAFDPDAAKNAYYDMMQAFGYPIPATLKDPARLKDPDKLMDPAKFKDKNFWVADFVQRDFETLGMAGIFWVNESNQYSETGTKAYTGKFKDQRFGYLGHEIYLLPGQMLPEHRHVGGNEGHGPKMEGWHVRHGSVEFFGQHKGSAADEKPISEMPADQRPWGFGEAWFKCQYVAKRSAGEMYKLEDPETWHFMRAGPNGAIVSEYATYHNQVEFSKPDMEFASSKAKK